MASEPWMLRKQFDRLPREAQDKILGLLEEALARRGGDILPAAHYAEEAVSKIAVVFEENGQEVWQYT